ncbi:hypothetical protein E2C01_051195 [Portunus trituberculatus]|uniref:Uncharacterized protein n=1 Tax=Portunus trituberculatus TaxID=210409 RepID=A0A5B7GI22_PORTR|nr:hypothetical protein [Portunus trituberculatus]
MPRPSWSVVWGRRGEQTWSGAVLTTTLYHKKGMLRTTIVALREMPPVHDCGPIFDESQN